MQRLFEIIWFYYRLCTTLIWGITVFSIRLHLVTRSFLSVFGLFVCVCLLATYRLLTWQTSYFSNIHYSTSPAVKMALTEVNADFQEFVCTQASCQKRQEALAQLQAQQPTHRDILINVLLASGSQSSTTDTSQSILTTIRHFDPNHPLVAHFK